MEFYFKMKLFVIYHLVFSLSLQKAGFRSTETAFSADAHRATLLQYWVQPSD